MIEKTEQLELVETSEVREANAKAYNVVLWHEVGREHTPRSARVSKAWWSEVADRTEYVRTIVERETGVPRERVVVGSWVQW